MRAKSIANNFQKEKGGTKFNKIPISNTVEMKFYNFCRWVIIVDRWEGSTRRTMEEMKERFYNAINELHALRNENADALYYDAEHEKRRKEQLIKQWNRTEQQVVSSYTCISMF